MPPANPLADDLARAVGRLNRWATMHTSFEIPPAQARLLVLIEELEPARITTLARADHSTQPSITTAVQRLESNGWVERVADESDARASLVRLTGEGRAAIGTARKARTAALSPVLDRLSVEEQAELSHAVVALERVLEVATTTDRSY